MGFFKWLLGRNKKIQVEQKPSFVKNSSTEMIVKTSTIPTPEIVIKLRSVFADRSLSELNDLYYEIMEKLMAAKKEGNIIEVLKYSQSSLGLIEPLIEYNYKEFGNFDIRSIPAIENSLIYFAVNGNNGQLKNIRDIVFYFDDLKPFRYDIDMAFKRRKLAASIYKHVESNPKTLQSDLKKHVGFDDGRFISTTVGYMEKAGKLIKEKKGRKIILTVI